MADDNSGEKDPDAALVAAAIAGLPYDTRAYQQLVGRHFGLLFQFCCAYLRDPTEAEDACQVILLKVFTGLPGFQRQSRFKTWMLRIAMNTCYTRRQKLIRERERLVPLDAELAAATDDGADPAAAAFGGDSFASMIAALSAAERQLLNLRFVADLTLEEIADVLGLGLSATKMRYYRALEKLGRGLDAD